MPVILPLKSGTILLSIPNDSLMIPAPALSLLLEVREEEVFRRFEACECGMSSEEVESAKAPGMGLEVVVEEEAGRF